MPFGKQPKFTDILDEYVVLKLCLSDYTGTQRSMPEGFEIVSAKISPRILKDEKRLLKMCFEHWQIPYKRQLPGWRDDSPIFMLCNGKLVGGLYVCDKNEFDNDNLWGQLHYSFVKPRFRGKGLYSLLFCEALQRARSWGLEGVYLNADRYKLAEVYQRWGALICKRIPKSSSLTKRSETWQLNWLVKKIHDEMLSRALKRYASGILVDVGCGEKPYAAMTKGLVKQHIGLDRLGTQLDRTNIDVFASAYNTMLPDSFADVVLCTAVLEHLEQPQHAIREMFRILKPGGHVILSVPLFWHLHEEPYDFYRFTKHGLQYLFETSGSEILELKPLSGFWVTFGQEFVYYLWRFRKRGKLNLLQAIIPLIGMFIQWACYFLNKIDRSYEFAWMYLLVAKKK